jgi:hypothetical protein
MRLAHAGRMNSRQQKREVRLRGLHRRHPGAQPALTRARVRRGTRLRLPKCV